MKSVILLIVNDRNHNRFQVVAEGTTLTVYQGGKKSFQVELDYRD